jgi:hypothetical protein
MEWTAKTLDRLYELYVRHDDRLRNDIIQANRTLGSERPEKVKLERLTRAEFEALIREKPFDAEARRLWLQGIVHGYEHEFPKLAITPELRQTATAGSLSNNSGQRLTGT